MPRLAKDITGQVFNKLTAIKLLRTDKVSWSDGRNRTCAVWLWKCECGKEVEAQARYVCRGFKKSCGCHVRHGDLVPAWNAFKKNYADGDLTFERFCKLTKEKCHYCQKPPSNKRNYHGHVHIYNGLDRVDNSRGHDFDNVVPSCFHCNEWKRANTQENFLQHAEDIVLTQIKNEIEALYGTT